MARHSEDRIFDTTSRTAESFKRIISFMKLLLKINWKEEESQCQKSVVAVFQIF